MTLVHNLWSGWGTATPPSSVNVYTDGSHGALADNSSWSMCVGDQWLDANYAMVPADESLLQPGHVAGATLVGASIACTRGVYPAELQAITRVLAAFPLSFQLHLYTDSQSSIAAIDAVRRQTNERKRLRMAARPLLHLIRHLIQRRVDAGGAIQFSHVAAHTRRTDIHSVGNRLADYKANLVRTRPDNDRNRVLLQQLPLADCEEYLVVTQQDGLQLAGDPRCTALAVLRDKSLARWSSKPDEGLFAGSGMIELGQTVMREGSDSMQATLIRMATNSIHHYWSGSRDDSVLAMVRCACRRSAPMLHLYTCGLRHAPLVRQRLLSLVGRLPDAANWLRTHGPKPLKQQLSLLFPPPPASPTDPDPGLHQARCLLGAFTQAEGMAAAVALGLSKPDRRHFVVQLRLMCVEAVGNTFAELLRWSL